MAATAGTTSVRTLAVLGVGLIGGSFAQALRAAGSVEHVIGVGRSRANLDVAQRAGIVDRAFALDDAWPQALQGADVVLVATPVAQYPALLRALAPHLAPHAIVTDAGSTKQDVVAAARATLGAAFPRFVPGHPIAGSEQSGAGAADATLYAGREVILTPVADTDATATERVAQLWRSVGAHVTTMTPERHDAALAVVSHLPHLLAFAFMAHAADRGDAGEVLAHAGAGFRDFTRIAGSAPEMWRDVALANRDALLAELDGYRAALDTLRERLAARDGAALAATFERAAQARRAFESARAGAVASEGEAGRTGQAAQPGRAQREAAAADRDSSARNGGSRG